MFNNFSQTPFGNFFNALGSILNPIGSVVGGIFNYANAKEQSDRQYSLALQNFQLQKDAFDYQKQLQQDIFSREDTAIQRRAQDLEAAGLSKTLAAGSGANAGAAVDVTAPQMDYDHSMGTQLFSSLMDMYNSTRQTSSQMALANAQIKQLNAEARKTNAEANVTEETGVTSSIVNILNTQANTEHTQADTNKISYDIDKLVAETNLTETNITKVLKDMSLTDTQINKLNAEIDSLVHQNNYYDSMTDKNKAELTGIYLKAIQTIYDIQSTSLSSQEKEYSLSKWKETGLPVLSSFPTVSFQGYGLGFGASYSGPWIPGSSGEMTPEDFQTFVDSLNYKSPEEITKIWNDINYSDNGGEVYSDYPSYWKDKNKNK